MNVIVRKHYPVERLPDDLREAVGAVRSVTVTLEADAAPSIDRDELVRMLREEKSRMKPGEGVTVEEAVSRIRTLRDEWDD